MKEFYRLRRNFIIGFFVLALLQMAVSYYWFLHPEILSPLYQAAMGRPRTSPWRLLGNGLMTLQAINCMLFAAHTQMKNFWKWVLVLGTWLIPGAQWAAIIVLILQAPKLPDSPVAAEPDQNQPAMPAAEVFAPPATAVLTAVAKRSKRAQRPSKEKSAPRKSAKSSAPPKKTLRKTVRKKK